MPTIQNRKEYQIRQHPRSAPRSAPRSGREVSLRRELEILEQWPLYYLA